MQKNVLKHQFENFVTASNETLDKAYDRFQKLISQLEIHGAYVSKEDINQKFLRRLPPSWSQITLIMRNKPNIDEVDIDDLYNNLRVYEDELKRSSVEILELVLLVELIKFHLLQMDGDDLEELDLRWQVAMLTVRVKKFIQRRGRNMDFKEKRHVSLDKSKIECYNCHRKGHFARECRSGRSQGRRTYGDRSNAQTTESSSQALVAQDGRGGYDWSNDFEVEPVNYALMAISSSNSSCSSDSEGERYEFQNYDLKCREIKINLNLELENVVTEKDELKLKIEKWEGSSKNLTKIINSQMSTHDKNGLGFGTQMDDLSNKSKTDSENSLTVFEVRSSDEESTLENNMFIKANEYHAIPPLITGNPLTLRPDISFAELDEYAFRNKIIECKTTETNKTVGTTNEATIVKPKSVNETVVSKSKINRDEVIIEDWTSDDEDDVCAVQTVSSIKPNVTQAVRSQADKSDYDFYDRKSPERRFKNVVNTRKREVKPVWDYGKRVNHQNFSKNWKYPHAKRTFNPSAVLTRSGLVNTDRSNVSIARSISTIRPVRPVSTARPLALKIAQSNSVIRPNHPRLDIARPKALNSPIKRSYFTQPVYRPKDLKPDVKTFRVKNMTTVGSRAVVSKGKVENVLKKDKWGNPEILLQDHAVVDSGCSSHMTGNNAYLPDYEDLNRGFTAFGSDPKGESINKKRISMDLRMDRCSAGQIYSYLVFHMANLKYSDKHNMVAFLKKPNESVGFTEVVDFPKGTSLRYALTHNPTIYDSLVKQFWQTATVRTLANGTQQLVASIDSKEYNITEASGTSPDLDVLILMFSATSMNYIPVSVENQDKGIQVSEDVFEKEGQHQMPEDEQISLAAQKKEEIASHKKAAQATCASTSKGLNADKSSFVYLGEKIPIDASTLPNADLPIDPNILTCEEAFDNLPNDWSYSHTPEFIRISKRTNLGDPNISSSNKRGKNSKLLQHTQALVQVTAVWILGSLPRWKEASLALSVFRNKRRCENVIVVKNKARLVAQGHRQEEGIDYVEVVKALYGLHQAPRAWYETLSSFLLENGFRRDTIDKTLFIEKTKSDIICYAQKILDDLHGRTYILFGTTATTPIESNKPLVKDEDGVEVDVHEYRSMIGSLMYLTASRPDIMFAICTCARCRLDRKSTTGGCQFLGRRLISWQCKKQTIMANSTIEAEYVAAAHCCGQVLWIQNQMMDYGFNFMNTKIHIDNESTICVVKNPFYHSRTKHIEIRHHFIRDCYEKRLIDVLKIHTDSNVADLLTNPRDLMISMDLRMDRSSPGKYYSSMVFHMANLKYSDKHNMVAFLKKPNESVGFTEVVDFLKGTSLRYALTHNPTIYDSLVKQFWQTATVRTLANGTLQLVASIDSKEYIITEASVRSKLQLADATGIHNLSDAEIYVGLATLGGDVDQGRKDSTTTTEPYHKPVALITIHIPTPSSITTTSIPPHSPLHHSPYQSPPHSPHHSPPQPSPHFSPPRSYEAPLPEGNTSGSAKDSMKLKELMKVKTLEPSLKRKSKKVLISESAGEESEDQGRKFQDIDDDPLVSLVRESIKEKSTDFGVSKEKSNDKGKIYRRRARSIAKKIDTGLDAEEEINTSREEINTGIKEVSTGSTKVNSGTASKRGQREGKAPMVEEDIQATHKTKEQIRQEEAGLEKAIKLQA
ncbi:putative ribonuclease H-like domain-containing protein [Tanacetum coccineum]